MATALLSTSVFVCVCEREKESAPAVRLYLCIRVARVGCGGGHPRARPRAHLIIYNGGIAGNHDDADDDAKVQRLSRARWAAIDRFAEREREKREWEREREKDRGGSCNVLIRIPRPPPRRRESCYWQRAESHPRETPLYISLIRLYTIHIHTNITNTIIAL